MRTTKYIAIIILCLAVSVIASEAQDVVIDKIRVSDNVIEKQQDNLLIKTSFWIDPRSVDTDAFYTLTPVIRDANQNEKALPPILVNGSRRHKAYKRALSLGLKKDSIQTSNIYTAVRANNSTPQKVDYELTIPYEEWMSSASVEALIEPCGCGGVDGVIAYIPISTISIPVVKEKRIEKIKSVREKRAVENAKVYLIFPVNKTVLLPDYASNRLELERVNKSISKVQDSDSMKLIRISIVSYASPEGGYANNARLAEGRGQAFSDYLKTNFNLDASLLHMTSVPENWTGLVEMVNADQILTENEKTDIINIINNTSDLDKRKAELKAYAGGKPYQYILKNIYPQLRRIDCDIEYEEQEVYYEEQEVEVEVVVP